MGNILETLNPPQQEAVMHVNGPLLILAGAGSGKTRVVTSRVAWLIDHEGVNPWNICAITFTNKAAGEMRERVNNLVGFGAEAINVATFHSTCVRILRRFIDRIGYANNFVIYDSDDSKTVMKDVCKSLQVDTRKYKEKMFLNIISGAKEQLTDTETFMNIARGDEEEELKAKVYEEYQKRLEKSNALDFDDLIFMTVRLFREAPDVLEYYQERFRYLMVDEYQDTNKAQFIFVSLLAEKYRNLCVVGDDDQSIYGFRGADIGNILNFEKHFPEAKVIRLEQNYRSSQNILDAANAVIDNNKERKKKTLWTANGAGDRIIFKRFGSGREEASYIVDDIARKKARGVCCYSDSAVLYRTNAQSRAIEEQMIYESVPYTLVGGVNFYARKEIKDMIAYLKTIENGRDDLSAKRIINIPKRGIGLASAGRLDSYAAAHDISFFDACAMADKISGVGRSSGKVLAFAGLIKELRESAKEKGPAELLKMIIEKTGYVEELRLERTDEALERISNIDELISKAASYESSFAEADDGPDLQGFLEELALVADIDNLDENSDRVRLMTLHAAKGLEFENVYLAGMDQGIFPSYHAITSLTSSELEEERRLCYVGITRAKRNLTLSSARSRMVRGEVMYYQVSEFVDEIPKELLDDSREQFTNIQGKGQGSIQQAQSGLGNSSGGPGGRQPSAGGRSGKMSKYSMMREKEHQEFEQKPFYMLSSVKKGSELAGNEGGSSGKELGYKEGDRVRHVKFGSGIVKEIKSGGRDYEVTVEFDSYGVKKMFATFAKLQKEENA